MAKKETVIIRIDVDESQAKQKIVENTTAIRNYAAQNRDLAKSLKENKISEDEYTKSLLANQQATKTLQNENKQLETSLKATDNSVEGLRARIALLTAEANKVDLNSEEYAKTTDELQQLNAQLIQIGKDRSDFRANVGNYASSIEGFETKIADLKNTIKGLDLGSKEYKEAREELEKVTDQLEKVQSGVGGIEGKLNDFGNKLSGISSGFGNLGTSLSAAFGPVAIIAGVGAVTAGIVNLKMEIDAARGQVNLLTGATGDGLDRITAKVTATADTFGKDLNEVLLSSNTAAAQFGIGIEEATDLIQKGFVNGADASGNFLADLTEFAPQFNAIGLSASESIAILSQQPESGVFSNKGIDAIKEAGIRLKEMPDATKQALSAIGLSSTTLQKQIADGTITSFEAIQQISGKLAELPPTSQQAAQAVADIFGGAGQDAGLQYLTTLQDINTDLDELTEGAGEFANANLKIVDAQERINLLFNQVLGSGGDTFKNLKAAALDFVANALEFIVNGVISVINFFRELYNESMVFRGAIQLIKAQVVTAFDAIKMVFNNFLDSLKNVGALLKAIFTGDFAAIPGIIKKTFTDVADNVTQFGKDAGENFTNAIKETISPSEILEPISLTADEAVTEFYNAGLASGAAFAEGVKLTRAQMLEDQKAFLEAQLLLAEENSQKQLEIRLKLIEVSRDIELEAEDLTANEKLLIRTEALVASAETEKAFLETQKQLAAEALAKSLADIEDGETRKSLLLQQQLLNREISEQEFNDNLFQIRAEALDAEIEQLEAGTLAKLEKEVELEQLKADRAKELAQAQADASNLVKATEVENNKVRAESAIALADGLAAVASEGTVAAKIAAAASKALTVGQIVMNLQQELAANAVAGAKIAAVAPPTTTPAGIAYTTTRNILAGVRAGASIAKIATTVFEHGGQAYADNLAFSGGSIPRFGGMIKGLSHREGGVKFNMGNRVGEADGRKGEAYIVNTRNSPMLKALASQLNVAGGGRAFYDLGGVVQYANGGVTPGVTAGGLLPSTNEDLAAILENMPAPIVLVDDIYNGIGRKTSIEDGAVL